MQQRLRVAADSIHKDLMMAGAGMYSGNMIGTLDAYFSPLLPHRVGTIASDPAGIVPRQSAVPADLRVGGHDHVRADDDGADDDRHRHADSRRRSSRWTRRPAAPKAIRCAASRRACGC